MSKARAQIHSVDLVVRVKHHNRPDDVLVHQVAMDKFVDSLGRQIKDFTPAELKEMLGELVGYVVQDVYR